MSGRNAKLLRRLSERTGVSYRDLKKEWVNLPVEIRTKIRASGI